MKIARDTDAKVNCPSAFHADPVLLFDKNADPIQLLTISEVAEVLKISVPSVRRLYQRRAIPFIKVGGCIRFATSDIASFLKKQRVEPIG